VGPKLAFEVVQSCLRIHGHGAYPTELPYEQRLRDVLACRSVTAPHRS
jgi:cyclohexanecarboxyl-CoA dehydrogenase